MKEMVGGCCVCSDERGWPENPLVYCDGQNCTVAVHQACYGIVTVPTGPWFCRKCESQERSVKVRCELCPSRDGALKRTDNQGWAHVVCALYIPEVRFGNVTTMEPIILQLIPQERYAKTCYICHDIGKPNRANVGACMQCNKFNCKQQFHVTCAQSLGLLCEEAGNYLDNVKYCGYCQHHYSKLKKGGNVKTIPPYKPITHDSSGSDSSSSPEKEIDSTVNAIASSTSATSIKITTNTGASASTSSSSSVPASSTKQRKSSTASKQSSSSSSSSSGIASGPTANNGGAVVGNLPSNSGPSAIGVPSNNAPPTTSSGGGTTSSNPNSGSSSSKVNTSSSNSSKEKEKHGKSINKISSSKDKDKDKDLSSSSSSSSSMREKSSKSKNKDSTDHGNNIGGSSTASGVGTGSSSIALTAPPGMGLDLALTTPDGGYPSGETLSNTPSSTTSSKTSSSSTAKKRKAESKSNALTDNVDINHPFRDIIKDVSVTLMPLPLDKSSELGDIEKSSKKQKTELSPPTHQSNEGSIPNVSPKHLPTTRNHSHSTASLLQTPQVAPVDASNSSSSSSSSSSASSHHKQTKERDERLRSSPPYASASGAGVGSGNVAGPTAASVGSTTTSGAPSLYVSVPLSTANVPGVSLPSTTTSDHPTPSQSTRAAIQQQQLQATSTIIERQSPRIHHQVTSSPAVTEHGNFSSSLQSPAHGVILQSGKSPSPNMAAGLTATTTESGNLKISYEKQNSRVAQLQEQESAPVRRSRTPDSGVFSSSFNISGSSQSSQPVAPPAPPVSNGGLKFTYEAQPGVAATPTPPTVDTNLANTSNPTTFKDSPPSSPGSEAGSARKRGRKANDVKDVKVFQNGGCAITTPAQASSTNGPMHATHMLGNQLNPTSSVAQKLTDQLHMEIQDHSVYCEPQPPQFVGVPFPAKPVNNVRNTSSVPSGANSLASMFGGGNGGGFAPQSLEQLLERQWEQGSQFLMEQAQHFDIASLLSCLHQLQTENIRLEDHVNNLIARRDHLLAVNARLAIPLNANVSQSQVNLNNIHLNGPTPPDVAVTAAAQSAASVPTSGGNAAAPSNATTGSRQSRSSSSASAQLPTIENGIDFRHSTHQQSTTSAAVSSASALPPSAGSGLRHSSTVHQNFSNTTSPSSASHLSNHQQHHQQHQQLQHHQQQQQQSQQAPTLSQHSTLSSSSSSSSASSTSVASSITPGSSRQSQQQQQLPLQPAHHHQTQPPHSHQQSHHSQSHHSHHVQQQQQQQPQSLHSHHTHSQHPPHPLAQQQHHHHHLSSTGTAAPHHMQQPTSHHQISISSSDTAMRASGTGMVSGSGASVASSLGRSGNSGNSGVGGANSIHTGRPTLGDSSAYHPVYSHQSQLRRDESQGKPS